MSLSRHARKKSTLRLRQILPLIALSIFVQGCSEHAKDQAADRSVIVLSEDNLLSNPGFENEDSEFSPWVRHVHADSEAFTFVADDSMAKEGTRSLRIERVKPEPYASIVQSFRKKQITGSKYRLSAWVRGQDLTGPVYLHAAFFAYGSPFAEVGNAESGKSGTFEWTRIELDVPMPERFDQVEFGLSTTGDGALWVDGAELVALPDP